MVRAAFMNVGMMGHATVGAMLETMMTPEVGVDATHVNIAKGLTFGDRVVRRIVTARPLPARILRKTNLDLRRWRSELSMGIIAAHRLRELEARGPRFEVLHFHTQPCAYASLARMAQTPSVVSIDHTQELARVEAPNALERQTYWPNVVHDHAVFRAARAIVSASRWTARDVAQNYPDCAAKVTVLPWAVRLEGFDPTWPEARAGRAGPVRFLFMGWDFTRKGGHDVLEAWRAAGLRPEHAELQIVTMEALPALPPGVTAVRGIKARTPEWFEAWKRADVFVLPTRAEAFGVVFQEAAAAGLPAIGTRLSAIPEIIAEGRTGLLVPPRDVPSLVAAMRALIADAGLRRALGTAARRKIEEDAGPHVYARALSSLMHDLRDAGGARRVQSAGSVRASAK